MRVLLFVEGKNGPKCAKWWGDCRSGWLVAYADKLAAKYQSRRRRYWLVECENAEAGRRVITSVPRFSRCGLANVEPSGRILASGGRDA